MLLRIILFEIRKLCEQPIIYLFFVASLLLNMIYIMTANLDQTYLNYIQETEEKAGTLLVSEFREKISGESVSKEQQRLLMETDKLDNTFQDYSTTALAQEMIDFFNIEGSFAEKITRKYERLTPVVNELAKEQYALEVGAAGETMRYFPFIRNQLFRLILGESLIFCILLGLYGSTAERLTKTNVLVLTSKTGRRIQINKYIASFSLSFLFYISILLLTFGIFNNKYSIGTLWESSVSTQFHVNVYFPELLEIPFIPWQPMTLSHYVILSIIVGGILIMLCHGFNFLLGLWTDHIFRGLVIFIVIYVSLLGLEQIVNQLGWWDINALLMYHPILLWKIQSYWFTEMGPYATIPWQESVAVVANLLILSISGIITSKFYSTKEIK